MAEADEDGTDLVPKNKQQSMFAVSADDIVDSALANLDEAQARRVTEKAADEIVRLAVEKRKAEYRTAAAHDEMNNLINNANLLEENVSDYKITSTFETASGTTNVEIKKSTPTMLYVAVGAGLLIVVLVLAAMVLSR